MKSLLFAVLISAAITGAAYSRDIQQRPPPAFSECVGQTLNADCAMRTPSGQINRTCEKQEKRNTLLCAPKHRKHARNHNTQNTRGPNPRRPLRKHTAIQSGGIQTLIPATESPIAQSQFSSAVNGRWRIITSNGIPDHKTGPFPNRGNPHRISEQEFNVRIPAKPELGSSIHQPRIPGWLLNGVPLEPGAAEFYRGDRSSGWRYEALSGAVRLGLDANHAHVQPSGKYHYHGLPTLFLEKAGVKKGEHSPQIGWAADGFPIYALYGGSGQIKALQPSYRLKSGNRPAGPGQPGGQYDGTFTQDYEYVQGLGNLDECNGTMTVTPAYPQGTYAYFLTSAYPVLPRCLKGKNIAVPERRGRGNAQ